MKELKFVGKVKLTKQGQLTLPQEARNDLHIAHEAELYWYKMNNFLVLVKDLMNEKELEKHIQKKRG